MTQLPLPFLAEPSFAAADLMPDTSNAEALAWLAEPARWPQRRLALWGPPGVGKSHLLAATALRQGWERRPGHRLRGLPEPPSRGVVLDDAHLAEEAALFHLINICAETGQPLLLAAREAPARWPVALPDLASRLRGTSAVAIKPPSEALLAALLAKAFADRQLRTEPSLHGWLLARLPREAAAMAEAAARLDRAALATGWRITPRLAQAALGDLLAEGDDRETVAPAPSPPGGGLL